MWFVVLLCLVLSCEGFKAGTIHRMLLPMQEKLFPQFQLMKMEKCFEKHQYAMWRSMMENSKCSIIVHHVEELELAKVMDKNDNMYDTVYKILAKKGPKICNIMAKDLTTCLYTIAVPFLEMVKDKKNCPNDFIDDSYSIHDAVQLIDSMVLAFCARNEKHDKSCMRTGLESFFKLLPTIDEVATGPILSRTKSGAILEHRKDYAPVDLSHAVANLYNNCDETLGCCGQYFTDVAKSWTKINTVSISSYIPAALLWASNAKCKVKQGCSRPIIMPKFKRHSSVASIPPPLPEIPNYANYEPQQVHIALAGKNKNDESDAMAVMFVSYEKSKKHPSFIQWGRSKDNLEFKANCKVNTYNDLGKIADGISVVKTYNHRAILTNLKPNTKYYYQCINANKKSEIFHFTSAPSTDFKLDKPISIAVFGDMGLYESQGTMALLQKMKNRVSMYLHLGDISYADNWMLHNLVTFGYETVWNKYMNMIQPLAAYQPFHVVPGNHESECHSALVCMKYPELKKPLSNYTAYNHRFNMPSKSSKGSTNMWYSYNYGPAHFVSISTETDFTGAPNNNFTGYPVGPFGDQMAWLENDLKLANKDRSKRPFIIVSGHRPLYNVERTKLTAIQKALIDWLEPLFAKYHVDIYFSGHVHSYERNYPIYQDKRRMGMWSNKNRFVNPKYTTYIVHGAGGNEELHTDTPSKVPSWNAFTCFDQYGIGVLTFKTKTLLKWEYISAATRKTLDSFVLDVSDRQ